MKDEENLYIRVKFQQQIVEKRFDVIYFCHNLTNVQFVSTTG